MNIADSTVHMSTGSIAILGITVVFSIGICFLYFSYLLSKPTDICNRNKPVKRINDQF
jgi:hypothetical protein